MTTEELNQVMSFVSINLGAWIGVAIAAYTSPGVDNTTEFIITIMTTIILFTAEMIYHSIVKVIKEIKDIT